MKFIQFAALVGTALALPSGEPALAPRQACTNPKVRKSWRDATTAEKRAYLDAAVCVTKAPSRLKTHPNATLHDDFGYVHAVLSDSRIPIFIHGVPTFLPWHRYFVQVYEDALRDCGYTGAAMYWDWVKDSNAPSKSSVWDPVTGFGGNGAGTEPNNGVGPRVQNGPFRDYKPLYWGTAVTPHWLSRNFLPGEPDILGWGYTQEIIDEINAETSYNGFRSLLEDGPHSKIHFGVGGGNGNGLPGDLGSNAASPNDPIFFLHHAQVDRLWWLWQEANPNVRTDAYDGTDQLGRPVSLNDTLPMEDLAPDGIVKDYMDVKSPKLCYTYTV
ncbi:hypothetical protein QBC34DRAFT_424167 [Podospora aff. communis PSN243]|uniref:Tyrosinase copper-binding domain-containing protein n=1 Tax=Podospora aff. communis PSN243 TaxID=3040156 RepID=A0AAV9GST8_9PEZI|nr:hypothetical protein QBC34DRAFT_424167 [Podospora aff. communis PSN243]